MKKILFFVVLIISSLFLSGCGKKEITVNDFLSVAGRYGYISEDITNKDKVNNPKIVQSISVSNNSDININFIVFENLNAAFNKYSIIQKEVEKFRQQGYLFNNISETNYESYTLNTEENYYYVARLEKTYLYIKGNYKSKDEIVSFVEEIGY